METIVETRPGEWAVLDDAGIAIAVAPTVGQAQHAAAGWEYDEDAGYRIDVGSGGYRVTAYGNAVRIR